MLYVAFSSCRQSLETYAGIVTHISLDLLLATLQNMHGTIYYEVLEAVVSVVAASISTLHSALRRRTPNQRDTKGLLNMAEQMFNRVMLHVGQWLNHHLNSRLDDGNSHCAMFADRFELEVCTSYCSCAKPLVSCSAFIPVLFAIRRQTIRLPLGLLLDGNVS